MLMPGNRSGRYGSRGIRIDSDAKSAELHGNLRALFSMYRCGEIPECVVRLVHRLEEAYWDARLAENGEEKAPKGASPTPRHRPN